MKIALVCRGGRNTLSIISAISTLQVQEGYKMKGSERIRIEQKRSVLRASNYSFLLQKKLRLYVEGRRLIRISISVYGSNKGSVQIGSMNFSK